MANPVPFSLRVRFAKPSQEGGDALAAAREVSAPNEGMRRAITRGAQKLVLKAQKDRFTGQGPFPVAESRLGVVSGRLRRDLHAEEAVMSATGYTVRMGATVEYFGAHERGFQGTVQVPAHTREAYTVNRKPISRTGKNGKTVSIRANQFSVLPTSVRAHTRKMKVPARKPLATAITQHGGATFGREISKEVRKP